MKTVLITWASDWIWKEFAKIFAKNNYNVDVDFISMDLSKQNSWEDLFNKVKEKWILIDILVNNAWFWKYWIFTDWILQEYDEMINLNINTLTSLTYLFWKEMQKSWSWKILNVSSSAWFQPVPRFSVYSSTKSYVLHFSEALHFEFKKSWVNVSVLCPPPTATSFEHTANVSSSKLFRWKLFLPENIALSWYEGLMRNQMTIIPWYKNKFMAFMSWFSPSRLLRVFIADKIS